MLNLTKRLAKWIIYICHSFDKKNVEKKTDLLSLTFFLISKIINLKKNTKRNHRII